ncbi:MAG: class I SAM-dependent methyltransferase [Luteolibacter sp.]
MNQKSSFPPRPTTLLHTLLREVIAVGDVAIDATAGNGHDTVFLAECVGGNGSVLAFDVQEAAIASASARVSAAGFAERVRFFLESHANLAAHVEPASVAAVIFNLGYLPGEDHARTTQADETVRALGQAKRVLKSGGVLAVVCYPGHEAGAVEAAAVEVWMTALAGEKWRVAKYAALGTLKPAPFLLIGRKAEG